MTSWEISVPFAGEWLTANPRSTANRYGRARAIKAWRTSTEQAARAAGLPKDITPVTIHAVACHTGRPPVKDRLNLSPTIKAVVDGLTPTRLIVRKDKATGVVKRHLTPGYGFLPDDSDRHVLDTTWELQQLPPGGRPHVVLRIHHEPAGGAA